MTHDNEEPSAASAGSASSVPAWADDLGREIACYLYGISALRHGLTMPGGFIPCVSAALRGGFASGRIRLPTVTDAERFVLREVRDIYANEDDTKCNEIAAVIDGLLERHAK